MDRTTPAPWTIRTDPTEQSCKAISAQFEYEPREFASVWVAREISKDNARLIAAAPELLAACEAARYELTCLEPRLTDEFRSGVVALRESITAAIAKAKGQL